MIGNVFVVLLVLGLAALFGWLALRALRSRRGWVKVLGGLVHHGARSITLTGWPVMDKKLLPRDRNAFETLAVVICPMRRRDSGRRSYLRHRAWAWFRGGKS